MKAYEKYMPQCNPACPSTGCYTSYKESILTYQCIHCELTSTVNLLDVPTSVLQAMKAERQLALGNIPKA